MEKSNKNNAREARTTSVDFNDFRKREPMQIGRLLEYVHNCRDCQRCYKLNNMWHCYIGMRDFDGNLIKFKHHRLSLCANFLPREKKST